MRKTIKRLGAVLLAMAMAVSVLCTGALAEGTSNSITIKTSSSGHTYEAYQVFAGSTGATTDNKTSLGITGWGSGVKASELVTALQTASNDTSSKLHGKFANILNKGNTSEGVAVGATSADAAQNVAASITDFNNNEAKAFAKIVAAHLSDVKQTSTETKNSDVTTGYKIDNLEAGYYLVKDQDSSIGADKEDAYTNYIMEVVGAVTVTPKSAVPKVDKKIAEGNDKKDATTAKVGDVVNFELTGALPSNYEDYTSYKYEFQDTLSKGLTYNDDIEVYVKNGTTETKLASDSYTVTPAKNTATTTPTDATTITVTFADLKTAKGENNADVTIDKDSKIIVKYSATLNENAIVGGEGNTNTVKLVYSNDPNGTSTGTTKDDKATVYTFQLNVTKVDGADNTKKLAGAKFKLYYEKDGTKYYATVNLSEDDNKDKITGWTTTEANGTELTTDTNGNITVKGLKEGTYYLEETEAPAGYNKLTAPVEVEITKNSTNIHELHSVTADNESGTVDTTNKAIGTITIANNKGSTLPSTGGMGTKLFYTIGGILMAGAAIVLVVRKRRSDAE